MTGYYCLADMPVEFQKALDGTLNNVKNTINCLGKI